MTPYVSLVGYLFVFVAAGVLMVLVTLLIGKLVRPSRPNPEKEAIYECGEPAIGTSRVQFDMRFYVVALLFVIFDVELALFFPWAVVFGKASKLADRSLATAVENSKAAELQVASELAQLGVANEPMPYVQYGARWLAQVALADLLVFFGVLIVGFAYLWKRGDIEWVRAIRDREQLERAATPTADQPVAAAVE